MNDAPVVLFYKHRVQGYVRYTSIAALQSSIAYTGVQPEWYESVAHLLTYVSYVDVLSFHDFDTAALEYAHDIYKHLAEGSTFLWWAGNNDMSALAKLVNTTAAKSRNPVVVCTSSPIVHEQVEYSNEVLYRYKEVKQQQQPWYSRFYKRTGGKKI